MTRLVIALLLSLGTPSEAQRFGWLEERLVERDIFPGNAFTFCRAQYSGGRGGRRGRSWGGSWRVDYPQSDQNFSLRLSQLTTLSVKAPNGHHPHGSAPRGYYMLFVLNNAGVPSEGKFIKLR